jgi:hypothetical protein
MHLDAARALKGAYDRCFARLGQAISKKNYFGSGSKIVKKQQVFSQHRLI